MHESLPSSGSHDSGAMLRAPEPRLRSFPTFPQVSPRIGRELAGPSGATVVVVDPWGDTEEVLGTVLRRRGHRTQRVRSWQSFQHHRLKNEADVVVLDAELLEPSEATEAAARFADSATDDSPRVVVLGKFCGQCPPSNGVLTVSKPYCVAWLVRKIEELLAGSATAHRVARAA